MSNDFWEGYVPEPDKRQQALDKKAENARELGLDYEPAQYSDIVSDGGLDPRNKFDKPAQQCKWPTCQSEEYQQALAEQIKRDLVGEQSAQRTWVGLTDEERVDLWKATETDNRMVLIEAIEAKLRSKNEDRI